MIPLSDIHLSPIYEFCFAKRRTSGLTVPVGSSIPVNLGISPVIAYI